MNRFFKATTSIRVKLNKKPKQQRKLGQKGGKVKGQAKTSG